MMEYKYLFSFSATPLLNLGELRMEFLEEEPRTRFLLHSRASSSTSEPEPQSINKRLAFLCASLSISLSLVSIFFIQSETLKSLVLWFALSFIVGPFAPTSITAGDIRVGHGKLLDPPAPDLDPSSEPDEPKKRRQRTRKPEEPITTINSNGSVINSVESERKIANSVEFEEEEKDWTDQDFDLLKKQMFKHPVGETGRWELIAEPFRGRHRVESVIKMGKSMAEKRPGSGDSFAQFLKQRKPMDRRLEAVSEDLGDEIKRESGWSSGEDIALLNALKVFPKEVSMRWEKIAASVPGRSKAACMKRVADLKRDFRSSKASS